MIESATRPMPDASRIRLSWPISEKLGVYAAARSAPGMKLARVEPPVRVDLRLVGGERRELLGVRYSSLVMPIPCSPEMTPPRRRASAMIRATAAFASPQHRVVVGVDRQVRVHVAVAGVHVQRDEHAAAAGSRGGSRCSAPSRARNAWPPKISSSGAWSSAFHDATAEWSCSDGNVASMRTRRSRQRAATAAISARASSTFAAIASGAGADLVARSPRVREVRPREERARAPRRARACSKARARC